MTWYIAVLKKYAVFSGRARRKEYWMFVLFNIIFSIVAIVLDNLLGTASEDLGYGIIYGLYSLAVLLPGLAVTVRRLHDIGKSGWWIFISLIPIIGSFWLLILLMSDSQPGENQYGPNPKEMPAKSQTPATPSAVKLTARCPAYRNGRCVDLRTQRDTGPCSWNPDNWVSCSVAQLHSMWK